MGKAMTQTEFENKINNLYGNEFSIVGNYINSKTKVLTKHNLCNTEWLVSPDTLLSGKQGCRICFAKRHTKTHEQYVMEMKNMHPNIIVVGEYKNYETKVLLKCNIDGYEWEAKPSGSLLYEKGCPKCGKTLRREHAEFVNIIKKINNKIEIIGEYKNANTKVQTKCKDCNHVWFPYPNHLVHGSRCPICTRIKNGNSEVYKMLRSNITDWKKESMEFSDYKCILTKTKFDDIHHLYSFKNIVDESLSRCDLELKDQINDYSIKEYDMLRNTVIELHKKYSHGICLNTKLHQLFHAIYGYTKNTTDQFLDFVYKLDIGDFDEWLRNNKLTLNINYQVIDDIESNLLLKQVA